jgi:hypothetical protein
MTREEVIALMESSTSETEWNDNCDKVKSACGGYPDYWWEAIMQSGLSQRVTAAFGGSDEITVSAARR